MLYLVRELTFNFFANQWESLLDNIKIKYNNVHNELLNCEPVSSALTKWVQKVALWNENWKWLHSVSSKWERGHWSRASCCVQDLTCFLSANVQGSCLCMNHLYCERESHTLQLYSHRHGGWQLIDLIIIELPVHILRKRHWTVESIKKTVFGDSIKWHYSAFHNCCTTKTLRTVYMNVGY